MASLLISRTSSLHLPKFLTTFGGFRQARYDPNAFTECATPEEILKGEFDKNDPKHFMYTKPAPFQTAPVFYRDPVVDKFVRVCMHAGKKNLSLTNVYKGLEIVKRIQYKKWLARKPGEHVDVDPFVIAHKAFRNCRPVMRLLNVAKGGTMYKVPFPLAEDKAEYRGMQMMRNIIRERSKKGASHFPDVLASELISASQNEGLTIQAKQEYHKLCEANRAFAHYR